ncbi:hypothetical protein K6Y76_02025 [Burkholderia cenocepacia]|jgi:nucleoside phosphorylase|uniref:5'-methylthioadenosine/S-adenosylhomocysteine nucleosidase family protein n=1 Tax=Burkholderia cenocepacia TaxID=95486 RepID=UPI0004F647EA|nr:hypothetical protein [Burkholderia cenocepacia]AIO45992.1 phosphorylase superfamily protein [Burkholderia cepacia]KGC01984.1 phosphorylase superfamily protein [Burkholderia cepacia]MCG0578174.1 hypothetical protein [Burkholderia cenocepacia]MCW3611782.1 hypothetical protein [Burkholderia cenocepacia]MCW3649439.1 hypothetical protein [Burkholderia cenocepacia]
MRFLIVDDEYQKAGEITRAISSISLAVEAEHVTTASAARRAMRATKFDLLVIDLQLPDAVGAPPSPRGGLDLFDLLLNDDKAMLPSDVVFVTAREEHLDEMKAEVENRGAALCGFSDKKNDWKPVILGRIGLAAERVRRERLATPEVDVAIVTALLQPELSEVLRLDYGWKDRRFADDPTAYHFGVIPRADRPLAVVAATAQRKGMPSSAALAAKMVERFRPKYLVMLGICAGVKGKTNLGDVIVADPSWDCGSGKHAESADGSAVFLAAPYQHPLEPQISQLANELGSKAETKQVIANAWGDRPAPANLKIRIGPMASGAAVLATSRAIFPIANQNRELIAVEMEAYAVMAAADYGRKPSPIPIVIKSVCDFADAEKSDDWQDYASFTSARFFDVLVRSDDFPILD